MVWQCGGAFRLPEPLGFVLSSPPAVLSLGGCCALFSFWFPLLQGGCASGLWCLGHTLAVKFVQSRLPSVVGPPSAVCLSFTCSCGTGCLVAVFWPLLLLLWVELPWGLCCGILSPWPLVAPSPSVVSRLGFFLWRLFRLELEDCGPVLDPPFFWEGLSFPCPRCFCLAVPTVCCPGSLSFLSSLLGFLSSRFQCLLIARGG